MARTKIKKSYIAQIKKRRAYKRECKRKKESYFIIRKKCREYRRECRRLLKYINSIKADYTPMPPFYEDEYIKLYANLFFKPKGKDRRELMAALLSKTKEIIAGKPEDLPFCKVFLAVYEENIAWSQIIIFFDEHQYNTFWNRTDIEFQKWTKINPPSLAESMGSKTDLNEVCYLEEVRNDEDNYSQKIWFYGEIF